MSCCSGHYNLIFWRLYSRPKCEGSCGAFRGTSPTAITYRKHSVCCSPITNAMCFRRLYIKCALSKLMKATFTYRTLANYTDGALSSSAKSLKIPMFMCMSSVFSANIATTRPHGDDAAGVTPIRARTKLGAAVHSKGTPKNPKALSKK